jgi:hypothetical protein
MEWNTPQSSSRLLSIVAVVDAHEILSSIVLRLFVLVQCATARRPTISPPVQSKFRQSQCRFFRYEYSGSFNTTTRAWLLDHIKSAAVAFHGNATHSASRAGAGDVGTDVSYNNMYYMAMVNGILFGEIAGDKTASETGYQLLQNWLTYAQSADIHELVNRKRYKFVGSAKKQHRKCRSFAEHLNF